jgi:hypothetical protein
MGLAYKLNLWIALLRVQPYLQIKWRCFVRDREGSTDLWILSVRRCSSKRLPMVREPLVVRKPWLIARVVCTAALYIRQ